MTYWRLQNVCTSRDRALECSLCLSWASYVTVWLSTGSHKLNSTNANFLKVRWNVFKTLPFKYPLCGTPQASSRVAQWERAGPITQRSMDRNHSLLSLFFWFVFDICMCSKSLCVYKSLFFNARHKFDWE